MYAATFTFAKREFDDDFHAVDQLIAQVAKSIPGYLGEESWENASSGLFCNVYYWQSMSALQQLIEHPAHVSAKQRQGKWLNGYHVTIAQVVSSYGDGSIAHPLAEVAPAATDEGSTSSAGVQRADGR